MALFSPMSEVLRKELRDRFFSLIYFVSAHFMLPPLFLCPICNAVQALATSQPRLPAPAITNFNFLAYSINYSLKGILKQA